MIARFWSAIATHHNVPKYVEHFQHSVLPELNRINGFVEGTILQRDGGEVVTLTVVTLWESMDAIRHFAGDQVETAVVEPAAQAVLLSFDQTVTHYEVLFNTGRKS